MVTPRNLSLFPFQLRRLLPLLLLPPLITHAQSPGSSRQPSLDGSFGSTTAVMIAILLGVFFFIGVFFLYIHRRRVIIGGNGNTWAINVRSPWTEIDARGLDPMVIESFPTMVYSDVKGLKMGDVALECAVCLCEFEEEDTLTMLPKCSHAFHPECIGMWLTSHHTCPVCRNDLRNPVPDEQGTSTRGNGGEAEREDQVMIRVDEEEGQDVEAELARVARIHDQVRRSWRSWSARPAVGGSWRMKGSKVWGEDERERFTLRLPENIRNELMRSGSSLRRSATVMTLRLNGGEESRRMGYREGGSFTRGTPVRAVRSDRWPYLRLSSFKAGDLGPLDRLSGGGRSRSGKSGEDEKSTMALTKH